MLKFYSILPLFIAFAASGCNSAASNNHNNHVIQNSVITHEINIQKSDLLKGSAILNNTNYYQTYTSNDGPMVTQMSAEFYSGDLCQSSTIAEQINLNFAPMYFVNPISAPSITFCKLYSNSQGTGCDQLFNDTVVSKKIKSIRINYGFNNGKSFAGTCLYNNNIGYETFADFSDPNNPKACSTANGEWQKCSLSQSYATTFIYAPTIQLLKTGQTSSLPFNAPLYSDGNLQSGILEDTSGVRFTTETKNGTTCIIDNLTGLEWPQDWSTLQKSHWSPTPTNLNICGYTDWRTPTQNEIMSLFDFSQADNITNFLGKIGFINIPFSKEFSSGNIWTAEEYLPNLNNGWLTNLAHSGNYYMDKNTSNYIIPVRNYNTKYVPPISTQPTSGGYGTPWPTKRFSPPQNYSGTDKCLTDSMTKLTWTSNLSTMISSIDFNQKYTLDAAISNAAILNNKQYCGYSDWRLPTIYELSLLTNYNTGPSISVGTWLNSQGFNFGNLYNNEFFWSHDGLPSKPNNHFLISMIDGYYVALNNLPPITGRNIFVHGPVTTFNTNNRFSKETVNGQTCLIDNTTGIEWPQDWNTFNQGKTISFDNALKDFTLEQQKSYCGHNDWHIPSVNELNSLINYLAPNPSDWLNANGFQNVTSGGAIATYWSSTPYSFNNLNYWAPNFITPQNNYFPKTSLHGFIMARSYDGNIGQGAPANTQSVGGAGIAWPTNRFITTADKTECVNDMLTGLMWIKDLNTIGDGTKPVNWQTAINNIDKANKGYGYCGYHDWRLPNITELRSLINYGDISPAGWLNNNKFILNIQPTFFWTSTTSGWDNNLAYFLSFNDGYFWVHDKNSSALVMPVRGGYSSKGNTKQPQSCPITKNSDGSYKLPGGDWQSFHLSPREQFYQGKTFPCHDTKYDGTTIETTCPTEEGHEMGRFIVGETTSSTKVSSCGTCSIVEGDYIRATDEVTYKIVCSEPQ